MSVRTTTVVGTGLCALAFIGVATIFGESLSALVTPPRSTDSAGAHAPAAPPPGASPTVPVGAVTPHADGGTGKPAGDGSS